ncbi:MAG: ABC transporter permease subunit [Myxococcales bacterium]|nr:ABC transporter permease subunit [Myxococcales bacterium]
MMQNTLAIAKRQFASYFNGATAYMVICAVLLVFGFFFWQTFFLYGRATVRDMFNLMPIMLLVAAPALTMGLLAEEKRTGTIELLLTMPVKDGEVVMGKFLGVLGLYAVLLLLTLPYPLSVSTLGPLDWGQVFAGYLGLILLGAMLLAIGLLASSWTDNQLVAFFVAIFACFVFWILDKVLPLLPLSLSSLLQWFSFQTHLSSMARGVVDTRDLFYFLSLTGFALLLAFRSLESRRWK